MTDKEYHILFNKSPREAQDTLFEEYFSYVYTIVFNKLRSCAVKEDIEECVSDVFADVFEYFDNISEGESNIKGFISTVAIRKAINMFHSLSSRNGRTVSLEESGADSITDSENIADNAERADLRRTLLRLVEELGEPDSSIIIQKYYYGMKSNEIAKTVPLAPAAACTVLIGGIAGSVYLMKDRTPNNKNEHSSSAPEPASLGEEGSIFDAVSWDRMRCTPFPDYAMIYEIPEDIAQKTGEALKSGQWNEMPDDTKLDISPVRLFIYNQGTPFRLDMYLIGEDYTSEGWLENSDFYIMFDNGEMKKLFKGDNTAKKAFELIYTSDIYSNNYIEVEEPFDDIIHKVWDYTETYESVPHMSYSADEVDLTSYDMTDTEGIVGRMLNNFHYCDKISGELIAPDSITSFQFDISADTGFWTQEPFHVNIISNDIMDENWYEIGEPYLSSNGYRSNINYMFEGKTMYSNTDSALYGEEFPGNTNMPWYRNYEFDRDSCYFKADEFIEYNKDKTTLSEDDFEKKYKNSTIYNTLLRNDCVYKGAPFSALSQLCSVDISSMKVEDGKTYMGRECLLLRADIPDRYKAPLTYSQESYSDGVHDETGDFIYNPMALVDYTEMLVDKETGVVLKQLFLNENGEAVFATGYSEIAFNENTKPLPDTEFTHPY